jgi:menaquinol-cytochrome c reductase iron-sulfur subunit
LIHPPNLEPSARRLERFADPQVSVTVARGMADESGRRKFLKLATCGLGASVGAAVGLPTLSFLIDPGDVTTVTSPREPLDLGDASRLGAGWQRMDVVAPVVRDAWVSSQNVVLGTAWVRKRDKLEALSGVCPHLGCAVGWQPATKTFLCPCHNSEFGEDGRRQGEGPAQRDLDPLPIAVENGRLRLTWVRYKLDTSAREPV